MADDIRMLAELDQLGGELFDAGMKQIAQAQAMMRLAKLLIAESSDPDERTMQHVPRALAAAKAMLAAVATGETPELQAARRDLESAIGALGGS
jgi:hypothetical protein